MLQGLGLFAHVANKKHLEYDSFKHEKPYWTKLEHLVQPSNVAY